MNDDGTKRDVIVIGASAGGVEAIVWLLAHLPATLDAAVGVCLHRSPMFESRLAWVFGRRSLLPVEEASDGVPIEPRRVYVAPRDQHLLFTPEGVRLDRGPKQHHTRPAVDPLFVSAAEAFGKRVVGLLLTGNGDDGVSGLIAIKRGNGLSLVQDPDEALFASMPRSALLYDNVDRKLQLAQMPAILEKLTRGDPA